MQNNLKIHVLRMLLSEKPEDVSEKVYQDVIKYVAIYTHELCSYIFRSVEYNCISEGIILNDENILSKLTPSYCILRANEYLKYLENQHEYAHECEELAR